MPFIDEAIITVSAGNGGNGFLSFRREKYVPRGGPDGGDGGDGGSVYLQGTLSLNTLSEFRYKRRFSAGAGESGGGRMKTGRKGEDLTVLVPLGTRVFDAETEELIGDVVDDTPVRVAAGGFHGLGNSRYKSSINRAPRQTSPGSEGEVRQLKLVLSLLADVGLLGLPNAGKSTFLSCVSQAKPKIAGYPFTTLQPSLGVVDVSVDQSFVIADIPGLIEGASSGAGLGIRFLKHLSRTKFLVHLVDIAPEDGSDPVEAVRVIEKELALFSPELASKPRWLVLNKIDLLSAEAREASRLAICEALSWAAPVFMVSTATGEGVSSLTQSLYYALHEADENT